MIYNPFMIDRHLNPRASGLIVFGGGDGGSAPYQYSEGGTVDAGNEPQSNQDKFSVFTNAINAANNQADEGSADKIGQLGIKLQALQAVAIPAFDGADAASFVQRAEEYKASKVKTVSDNLAKAQSQRSAEMSSGAREVTGAAVTDPGSQAKKSDVVDIEAGTEGTSVSQDTGQVTGPAPSVDATKVDSVSTVETPKEITASGVTASTTGSKVTDAVQDLDAQEGEVSADSIAKGATKDPASTGVSDLKEAQGTATMVDNPAQRKIQEGELISGVADAETASKFTEQIQAATATPSEKATVRGQLTDLMQDFEGGNTPSWAAGAMRAAMSQMASRGLSASSMAGQAIVQATMESALPIAMADAQTQSQFESQNLSNRQQRAMLAAQQRATFMGMEFDQAFQARVQNASKISDVANMNFTAEQQIALENSRASNTMSLANLSNSQAMVMAQAAAISQLESQNLSNQQQAAIQNAQAFLQMDMANLSNRQQTEMFKAQTIAQSIFTDSAAENAARQFNASSENQTKQFMASLFTQVSQFNSSQINATNQFNAGQDNAAQQFNASIENQRQQFNAQNSLVIAQANAQWRQNVSTINTAAQNESNANVAMASNAFTQSIMDQLWQRERDIMDYVYKSSESSKDRSLSILLADKKYDEYQTARDDAEETSKWAAFTRILFS
jgi:hypothetical protein